MNDDTSLPLCGLSAEDITEMEQHVRDRLASQLHGTRVEVGVTGLILRCRTKTYHAKQ